VSDIRPARYAEIDDLSALCFRSKAHWGYDAVFMARCRASLRVSPAAVRHGRAFVATDGADRPLGVAQIDPVEADIDLGLLFVDPPAMRLGVGRQLLRHAMEAAARAGATRMTVLADPYAAPFYELMGARFVSMAPSDAVPGRLLPLYHLDLR
jgi:GNAT superfamily N-acetyltransferase